MLCKECGAEIEENAKFCSVCGAKVVQKKKCKKCGAELDDDSLFCMECGTRVNGVDSDSKANSENESSNSFSNNHDKVEESTIEQSEPQMEELLKVVGKNTSYFEKIFDSIRNGNKGKFNWAALFFSFNYCFYRKSPEIAKKYFKKFIIVYIAALILEIGVCFTISNIAVATSSVFIACFILLLFLLVQDIRCGINFNKEYYNHCVQYAKENKKSSEFIGVSVAKCIVAILIVALFGAGAGATTVFSYTHAVLKAIDTEFMESLDDFDDDEPYSAENDTNQGTYNDSTLSDNDNLNEDNVENPAEENPFRDIGDITDFSGRYTGSSDGSYATLNIYSSFDSGSEVGNVSLFVGDNTDYPEYSSYSLDGEMMKVDDETYMVINENGETAYLQMIRAKYMGYVFNLVIDDNLIEQYYITEQFDLP